MKIDVVRVGYLRANCYLLKKENCVLVIDPGDEYEKIQEAIGNHQIVGVLITHQHPDHVGALDFFEEEKVYDFSNLKEGRMVIEPFTFEVIQTPGHKSDSLSFYFEEENLMFTGDFLFKGSVGRMDLPTGSLKEMKESLQKMKKYDPKIVIYPGHGPCSILGEELENAREIVGD